MLTKIVGPSDEGRRIGQQKEEWAERDKLRHIFWEQLLEKAKKLTNLHSNISPSIDSSLSTGSGLPSGLYYIYRINMHEARIELYIDRGQEKANNNIEIFNYLKSHKEEIEEQFGNPLIWDQAERLQACRVTYHVIEKGYREPEAEWPMIQDEMINSMIKLEKAFRPIIQKMEI